ncbi:MAG: DNA-3-methyladenine glycosylase 2 family protein [Mycobacteriales bacterium]
MEIVWHPAFPVDVRRTLAPLARGRHDPTHQVAADGALWRTTCTPDGPATYRLTQRGLQEVHAQAWGDGAAWVLERVPDLLGGRDSTDGFVAGHPLLAQVQARHPGLRIPRTGRVFEALVPAVLEQKVTGREARSAFQFLVRRYGEPAPGPAPAGMRVPPPPQVWGLVPSWEWHRAGVDGSRSATVMRAVSYAGRLEQCADLPVEAARARMQAIPGIGVWTSAEVAARSLGDADAVSYGDFHVASNVVFALTGETDGTDERLAELLEPWAGHRGRVVRLVELTGISRPARGPRYSPLDFRRR